jgi:succinate dehydrogenase/fumarate reductase flavoprotein subunit
MCAATESSSVADSSTLEQPRAGDPHRVAALLRLADARSTLESALERRETRGCHNRSDYPGLDSALRVNLVWSPTTGVTREDIPAVPDEISALMRDVSTAGKLVE